MFYAILKDISFIGATKSMVQIRKQSQVYFVLFLSLLCKGILPFKVFRLHEQNYRSIICQIYKKKTCLVKDLSEQIFSYAFCFRPGIKRLRF